MFRKLFASILLLVSAAFVADADGLQPAVDVGKLIQQLESDSFQERQVAQRDLEAAGRAVVDRVLASFKQPAWGASDREVKEFIDAVERELAASLDDSLFRAMGGKTAEGRYRAKAIRESVSRYVDEKLVDYMRNVARPLPEPDAGLVYGVTGGFRDQTPWFDGTFRNGSKHKLTAIRCLVRITHKETGKVESAEVVFGSPDAIIEPDATVKLSAKTELRQSAKHEFYWDILSVRGFLQHPRALEAGN
jgi:hypothetical protein